MVTYIILVDFTEKGFTGIKESTSRSISFTETAKKFGVEVKDVYWTSGMHDGVLIFDAPDEQSAASLTLHLGSLGNVTTTSLRAYDKDEFDAILAKMP